VTVFVPVGRHTLYGHATRILGTQEAQELTDSVSELVDDAKEAVVRETLANAP
jgi:hypothetical protein